MRKIIVAKFGGTSVKTASAINQVKHIITDYITPSIQDREAKSFIAVSAVGGITNKLVEFCNSLHAANIQNCKKILTEIIDIHINLAKDLNILNLVKDKIEQRLFAYQNYTQTDITPVTHDEILSAGEDLSSLIITCFLQNSGLSVAYLDARKYLFTDSNFGKAKPHLAAIKLALSNELPNLTSKFIITQGFIGIDENGRTTTLGRGGSDYSAALIAEAVSANELLIYTDVPGVYTMDPNIVKSAKPIDSIGFQEMAEMANFGAKILHPFTLDPCVRSKIPVRILSTFEPEKPGTKVLLDQPILDNSEPKIHAVTMRKNQILVTIRSLKMLNTYGFLANIFDILARYKVSVDLITTSEVSIALTVDSTMFGSHGMNPFVQNKELLSELNEVAEVIVGEGLTLIALVGTGLTLTGSIQKMLGRLQDRFVRLICYGASSSSVGILVHEHEATEIAVTLHKELLEEEQKLC